jgi:hypothetical protein
MTLLDLAFIAAGSGVVGYLVGVLLLDAAHRRQYPTAKRSLWRNVVEGRRRP